MDDKSSELLKKLEDIVSSNKDDEKGGSKGWIATIVIFFTVLIGIIVFAWVANRDAKELAKLRHEKNKRLIEQANMAVEEKVANNEKEKSKIRTEIDENQNKINKVDKEIKATEEAHKKNVERINSITSWRDI